MYNLYNADNIGIMEDMTNNMQIIKATGRDVFVDDDNFEYLSKFVWYYLNSGYAVRNLEHKWNSPRLGMHREIMNCPDNMEVDHINKNTLDNRKENLRVVSRSINNTNRRKQSNNKSGYIGVSWCKQKAKWRGVITLNGKDRHLGFFDSKIAAARAYNIKAKELGFLSKNEQV